MAGEAAAAIWEALASAGSAAAPYVGAASAAAGVGSAYANNRAAQAQMSAQGNALQAERERQTGLQKKANEAIAETSNQFTPEAQAPQLAALQAKRQEAMAPAAIPADNYATSTPSAPVEVKSDLGRQVAQAMSGAREQANRAGILQGFGDQSLANNIALGRGAQKIGQLENFSRGSTALVPLDIAAAHTAGGNWAGAGDILNSASNLGNYYAMTRKRKPTSIGVGYGEANPATASIYDAGGNLTPAI